MKSPGIVKCVQVAEVELKDAGDGGTGRYVNVNKVDILFVYSR